MKQLFKQTEEPKMLFLEEGGGYVAANIFYCAHCRAVYPQIEKARRCCQKSKCRTCDKFLEEKYHTTCEDCVRCHNAKNLEERAKKATKVKAEDYDGPLYDDFKDRYYHDDDELLDHLECDGEEPHEYIYACTVHKLSEYRAENIVEDIIERISENFEEEPDFIDVPSLEREIGLWLDKQTTEWWETDYKRRIVFDDNSQNNN